VDGLTLTADRYITSPDNPYIILLHEQNSSRGEFNNIARRLCKMDYNCLAVDLRNGGYKNSISNETAKRCMESKCSAGYTDIQNDILASIEYVQKSSDKPVILFGIGANASLGLKTGKEADSVRAVVAFSPGEYFLPELNIQDTISGIEKPVFVTSSKSESPYVDELVSGIEDSYLTVFKPQQNANIRGTAALSPRNENNSEYWLALLLFFKDLL
jgi:dienelactone hydrolase